MKKYELEIEQDNDPRNPREDDNITTMICFHRNYNLGDDTNLKSSDFDSWDELKEHIESEYKVLMIKPLYLYDHSGITISTGSFSCRWDSGQVGWVFVDEKRLQYITGDANGHTETNLDEIIEGEVKEYDKYLTGEVYGYKLYEVETCSMGHEHKTLIESCWGYYDEQDAEDEGKSLLEHYEKELQTI